MRLKLLRLLTSSALLVFLSGNLKAQNCIPTNINGAIINLACNQTCTNPSFQIPHIKNTSDYVIINIPYNPYPYNTPTGNEYLPLYADDQYSNLINLPFTFCFYDQLYGETVVGSNGIMTFDAANASCSNAWQITQPIPYAGGVPCNTGTTYYPRASIMGAYSDLDPRTSPAASPPERKIQWEVYGTAPCRKFVVSYFHVGVYGNSCGLTTPNTFQMVIHESTGIIEIFTEQKACYSITNGGRGILGIQNWFQTKAVAAPGKNNTQWSENNTGYRFIPSGAGSRYVISELYTLSGNFIVAADTLTTTPGLLDLTFPNLCPPPGNNTYVVKTTFSACDNPGNQLISYDTIFVNRTNSLDATATSTNTGCGLPSGTITATVPPGIGTAPFSFQLDGGAPIVTPALSYTFINVTQGPHTVVVTDASAGCTSTINLSVIQNSILNANATPTSTSCPAVNNGSISVTPVNGTGPYSFVLNPGGITQTGAVALFTGLAAGIYSVTVTDAGGCFTSPPLSVTVTAGPSLTTTVSTTDVLCNGGSTGIITVTPPVIGTAPYQYSLDGMNWQASNIFPGLSAGSYSVYYRESNGCQGSQNVVVSEPTAITPTIATIPAVCNGQNNGIIIVTAAGGIAPYQYSADGGITWQSKDTFYVMGGNYTVIVRDNNNCIKSQPVTVTEPAALTAVANTTNASCDGGNDGTITISAAGGNASYQYSIDGTSFQSSNVFNVAPGNYTVTVRDNLGCNTSFTTIVGLTSNLTLTPQTDPVICESASKQLLLNSNATQYAWTPATGLSNSSIPNPVASPVITTQYIVTATLGRCSSNDTVVVNVNAAPIPNAGPDGFICYGQTYRLQGSGGTTFSWTPSTYLSSTVVFNPVVTPDKTTTYTLSVIDANGCSSLVTDKVTVDVTPPIHVITFPFDTVAYPGDQFQLLALSGATTYTWSPVFGLSNPNIPDPVVTIGTLGSDVVYRVTASTLAGCKGEGFVRVKVYTGPDIYVPTGFTPNNDGKNDRFTPFPVGIKQINYFRVFNRWGQLIFSTGKLNDGWDGKFNGRDQGSGVYVWMLQGITKDNRVITKKGTVALIR